MTSIQEEMFKCVLSGDLETLRQYLEGEPVPEEPQERDLFGEKDECGRSALLTASMLGRSAIVRELVRHGARVNEQTIRGERRTAACWISASLHEAVPVESNSGEC